MCNTNNGVTRWKNGNKVWKDNTRCEWVCCHKNADGTETCSRHGHKAAATGTCGGK